MLYQENDFPRGPYLRRLPMLEWVESIYSELDLSEIYIICAQHVVSTTYSLFYSLLNLGLNPKNLSVIGKCYSTDPQAFNEISALGIDISVLSFSFNSHKAFDEEYRTNILQFVLERTEKLKNNKFKKIIVLDDGGELILAVNKMVTKIDNITGIEQTSSGYEKIRSGEIRFPVVNVARSNIKLNYESPIISSLIIEALFTEIQFLGLKPKKILILGCGAIGAQLFNDLKDSFKVTSFDKEKGKSFDKGRELEELLPNADLIIGCTGTEALTESQFKLLKKNVILVSASSSDREFNSVKLRKKMRTIKDCHQSVFVDGKYLINCGFPVNFSSAFRKMDPDELQLTRSILLTSILQIVDNQEKRTGFIPLKWALQKKIIQNFHSLLLNKEDLKKVI